MSTMRPMFSSATLRTSLPRTACTIRGSRTAADGGSELPAPWLSLGVSKVGAVLCALRLSAHTRKGEGHGGWIAHMPFQERQWWQHHQCFRDRQSSKRNADCRKHG